MAWGFARRSVRVNVDGLSKHLKVEGKTVVVASCVGGHLVCDWDDVWKSWTDLHDSIEFKNLFDQCANLLAGGGKGKGISKGETY